MTCHHQLDSTHWGWNRQTDSEAHAPYTEAPHPVEVWSLKMHCKCLLFNHLHLVGLGGKNQLTLQPSLRLFSLILFLFTWVCVICWYKIYSLKNVANIIILYQLLTISYRLSHFVYMWIVHSKVLSQIYHFISNTGDTYTLHIYEVLWSNLV